VSAVGAYRSVIRVFAFLVALSAAHAAGAGESPIAPFVGAYEGTTLATEGEVKSRDLSVVIRAFDRDGFEVRWRTLIFKPRDKVKGRSQVIYFRPHAGKPTGTYVATPPAVAAGIASDQPLDGRPFAWAFIKNRTLSVHMLTVEDDGGYVMQSYDRTLTETGLALAFTRVHNGQIYKTVHGELERIEDLYQPAKRIIDRPTRVGRWT